MVHYKGKVDNVAVEEFVKTGQWSAGFMCVLVALEFGSRGRMIV